MTKVHLLTFNSFQENTYLISDTETGDTWVIDPGMQTTAEERTFAAYLKQHDLKPVRLLLTHAHLDHIYGLHYVHKIHGLTPELHELETPVYTSAPVVNEMYGLPKMNPLPTPSYSLHADDTLTLGDATFKLLFTPGHSPGSLCFYNRVENYVIAGDVLFHRSIGRTDLPGGDHATLLGSIATQLLPLPDETVVYPGHGPSTTVGEEREENPFF